MKKRYPGTKPFTIHQSNIFFGRSQELNQVFRMMKYENIVVVYGKSGLGKSSLINAGVIPKVLSENNFHPIKIRFHAWTKESLLSPVRIAANQIGNSDGSKSKDSDFLKNLCVRENILWQAIKSCQIDSKKNKFLLVFDQFEELFTYPEIEIRMFRKELAAVLDSNESIPFHIQRKLNTLDFTSGAFGELIEEKEEILEEPYSIKILIAIRSDRLHLLNKLISHIPSILNNNYELKALSPEEAREALVKPALLKSDFWVHPFSFEENVISKIFSYLKDNDGLIESIQLQLFCETFEEIVAAQNLNLITEENIGNLEAIISDYYENKINKIHSPDERYAARKLIEEGLVIEGEENPIRLSMHEGQINNVFEVDTELLSKLVNYHLLRAEPSPQGGYSYEICHDTLLNPIVKAKHERHAYEQKKTEEEEKLRRQLEEEEKRRRELEKLRLKEEKKKRIFNARVALIGVIVSFITLATALLVFNRNNEISRQSKIIEREKNTAIMAEKMADSISRRNENLREQAEEKAKTVTKQANEQKILMKEIDNQYKLVIKKNDTIEKLNVQLSRNISELKESQVFLQNLNDSLQFSRDNLKLKTDSLTLFINGYKISQYEKDSLRNENEEERRKKDKESEIELKLLDFLINEDLNGISSLFRKKTIVKLLLQTADSLYDKKSFDKAIEYYDRAIEIKRNNVEGYVNRAKAKLMKQNYSGALEDIKVAVEYSPLPPGYSFEDIEKYDIGKYYQNSIKINEEILVELNSGRNLFTPLYSSSEVYFIRNNIAYGLAKLDSNLNEALNHIEFSLNAKEDKSIFWDTSAYIHLKKGELEKAKEDVDKAISLDFTNGIPIVTRGFIALAEGREKEFFKSLEEGLKAKKSYPLYFEFFNEKIFEQFKNDPQLISLLIRSLELRD